MSDDEISNGDQPAFARPAATVSTWDEGEEQRETRAGASGMTKRELIAKDLCAALIVKYGDGDIVKTARIAVSCADHLLQALAK